MGYLIIIRPVNCIITFISVLVGAWIGRDILFSPPLILAGMIGFIVCAFGNIVNDLKDIEIDKINNPKRPLASGQADKKIISIIAIFFFVISVLFSISLGILPLLLVVGVLVLLSLYAIYFKRTVWGNVIVALITGLTFIFGGIIVKNPACIFPFFFSFFIHFAREIVKDVIDIEGDRTMGVISLPIVMGRERACNLSALSLGIICILLPLPFILKTLNFTYMAIVLIGAYPMVIYTILRLLKKPPKDELMKLSNLIKISMVVGLIAMVV